VIVEVVEESVAVLPAYGRVPIAFRVESRFRVEPIRSGLGGLLLVAEPVAAPYVKDYDAIDGGGPSFWSQRWDISHWGVMSAFEGGERIGGAAVAWKTEGMEMLEGCEDLAVLWDLRVHPSYRGRGVGHRLFARAVDWARERQGRRFKAETQNINVPACRFYARQGCELGAIHRYVYGIALDEVQLLWYKDVEHWAVQVPYGPAH
jgi:GNAT superfamily N-acetyltransferase